jgi:hypothetical protein
MLPRFSPEFWLLILTMLLDFVYKQLYTKMIRGSGDRGNKI